MANDIMTQLQARNETLTQAIARNGSRNARQLQSLSTEHEKITRLTQQLTASALRREENSNRREALLTETRTFISQMGKLLLVEQPDWRLPFEFQDGMVNMAIKNDMDDDTRDALSLNLRDWSLDFNQDQLALQDAATTMMEGGIRSLHELNRYMPDIAKAATATRDSAQTWAQAAISTRNQLHIAPQAFHVAQTMLADVAKNGGVSVADQTLWIERFAARTGAQGTEGLAELAATQQIAMQNAPSAAAAEDNFAHFLHTTFSRKTDNWFASQGVDLRGSLLEHQQNGMGVAQAMAHIVEMQLQKMNPLILDQFKQAMKIDDLSARADALQALVTQFNLGEMFGDRQTLDFLAPMLANSGEFQQLKTSNMQAGQSTMLDSDFTTRMSSPLEQTKALQLALNDLWLTVGLQLMPAIGDLAESLTPLIRQFSAWLRDNPALVQGIAKFIGAIWLFNGALSVLKLGANLVASPIIRLIDLFLKLKARLALSGAIGKAWNALKGLGGGLSRVGGWLKGLGRGFLQLGSRLKGLGRVFMTLGRWVLRFLLMTPLGRIISVIVGAVLLIYRYFEPIKKFFLGLWERIKEIFAGGVLGITAFILDWSPLGIFYKAFAGLMSWLGIDLPASFSEFGGKMISSLVNSLVKAFPVLGEVFSKIKSYIPDWLKKVIGISVEPQGAAIMPGVAGMALAGPVPPPLATGAKSPVTPSPLSVPPKTAAKPLILPPRAQGNVQVHFSPQVTVQGNGANAAGEVNKVLALNKHQLEKLINDVMAQQQRRGYA
ncbi:phage tail tape measure protein [Metakosakonia massiliensis]